MLEITNRRKSKGAAACAVSETNHEGAQLEACLGVCFLHWLKDT